MERLNSVEWLSKLEVGKTALVGAATGVVGGVALVSADSPNGPIASANESVGGVASCFDEG